jgi:hypothetical protein
MQHRWNDGQGTPQLLGGEKSVPVPLFSPQMSYGIAWNQPRLPRQQTGD